MKFKVLVLDIDGTLNNSKKEVSPKTKKAIIAAIKNGVTVVLASGRPTCGVMPVAKEIGLDKLGGYILSFNGGRITNCKTGEIIYEKVIPQSDISEIYNLSKEFGVNILTYSDNNIICENSDEFLEIECKINKAKCKTVDSLIKYIKHDVPKFLMHGDGNYLEKIEPKIIERLGNRFNAFRSEPFFLEIMPKNIDKAYSLGKLLCYLGLTKDVMIACGDGFNDVSMIEYAGLGVAMENAQPAVKAASNYITLSNDNDGIAHVIEKFIIDEQSA